MKNKNHNFHSEDTPNHDLIENDQKINVLKKGFSDVLNVLWHQNVSATPVIQKQKQKQKPKPNSKLYIQRNKQVNIMNRGEELNKALKALQNGSPDVEAVALISEDGLMIASALPQDLDEVRVGGMSATLLSLGTRSSAELRRGKVEEIIVRGEHGYTVMLYAGRGTLLLVVANENAKLGLIFFDMQDTIEKLKTIL